VSHDGVVIEWSGVRRPGADFELVRSLMRMQKYFYLFVAGVALSMPLSGRASTYYLPLTNEVEIINDDDTGVYLRRTVLQGSQPSFGISGSMPVTSICAIPIFRSAASRYPWGKDKGDTRGVFLLSDTDYVDPILSVVKRLRLWTKLSLKQKLASIAVANDEGMQNCIESAQADIDNYLKESKMTAEATAKCALQGKTIRATPQGKLCLSDFEFAQLQILEEQKNTQEAQRRADELYRQELEQAQEKERRRQAWSDAFRNMSESLRQSAPRNCYGTSTGYGSYRTFSSTCY